MQQEGVPMSQSGSIIVTGKNGLQGTIAKAPQQLSERDAEVLMRLENGQEVLVPVKALILRSDGSYYLPLSLTDIEQGMRRSHTQDTMVVPVLAEELDVQKRQIETGRVRIKMVVHERQETVDQPLMQDEIEVKRVPINRVADGPTPVRYENDVMIVPVLEEVLVVEKRLMLKEELHISKRRVEVHKPQQVTLRREEAIIERIQSQESNEPNKTASV